MEKTLTLVGNCFAEDYLIKSGIPFKINGKSNYGDDIFKFDTPKDYRDALIIFDENHSHAMYDPFTCPKCEGYNIEEVVDFSNFVSGMPSVYQCRDCMKIFKV